MTGLYPETLIRWTDCQNMTLDVEICVILETVSTC